MLDILLLVIAGIIAVILNFFSNMQKKIRRRSLHSAQSVNRTSQLESYVPPRRFFAGCWFPAPVGTVSSDPDHDRRTSGTKIPFLCRGLAVPCIN